MLTSPNAPSGTIDLTTTISATDAQADGTTTVGGIATITSSASSPLGPGNEISQYAYSPTPTGGTFVALTASGDTGQAAAYGAIFDADGFAFVGVGGIDGTTVSSTVRDLLVSTETSLMLAKRVPLNGGWTLVPKIGPTYVQTRRHMSNITSVNINEGVLLPNDTPLIGLSQHDVLSTRYLGLVAGIGASKQLTDTLGLSLDVTAGLAGMRGHYDGAYSADLTGQAATNIDVANQSYSGHSYLGRMSINLDKKMKRGGVMSVGLFGNYMSAVPTVIATGTGTPDATISSGNTSATYDGTGQSHYTRSVVNRASFNYGITLTFIMRF
ncbi:MAG: hypothetical protein Q8Q26_09955 [Pseudorhodobacter sp.]|nr:hypothetical protein [Pseudorhodobacter sp.]